MGIYLALRHHGRRGVLGDHEARVHPAVSGQEGRQPLGQGRIHQPLQPVGVFRQGDAQKVHGQGHRLPVEIAAGDGLILLREDQGVVGDGVDLPAYHAPHIADGVPAGPVNLGRAADGVGVLHLVRIQVEGQPAALQQPPQVLRRGDLPRLAPQGVHLGIEGLPDAVQGLAGHGGGDVRRFGQVPGVIHRLAGDGRHDLGAVDQGQALLGGQLDGVDAGGGHGLPARHHPALILRLALAQHHQHHVGQGRQVAAGPQGPLLRDDRMDPPVQHLQKRLHGGQADAGIAPGQGVQPQQHSRPHHPGVQRLPPCRRRGR